MRCGKALLRRPLLLVVALEEYAAGRKLSDAAKLRLRELIDAFQLLTHQGITGMEAMNHGGSWSLYVPDPEGNTIELFVRTDWYVPPHATTGLDLSQPEALILQQTELMAKDTPGSKTWDVWRQEFQERMDHRG